MVTKRRKTEQQKDLWKGKSSKPLSGSQNSWVSISDTHSKPNKPAKTQRDSGTTRLSNRGQSLRSSNIILHHILTRRVLKCEAKPTRASLTCWYNAHHAEHTERSQLLRIRTAFTHVVHKENFTESTHVPHSLRLS